MRGDRLSKLPLAFAIAFIAWLAPAIAHGSANIFDDDWKPPAADAPAPIALPALDAPGAPPIAKPPADHGSAPDPQPTAPAATAQPPAPARSDATPRLAPPSKTEQAHSRELLREAFAKQLADRSIAGRRKLAESLIDQALKSADTPADQYVLLGGAIDAGKESSTLSLCVKAADELGTTFAVNELAVKADAAFATRYTAGSPAENAENFQTAFQLVDPLIAAEDYAGASRLCSLLSRASSNLAPLHAQVEAKLKDVNALRALREKADAAAAKLKTDKVGFAADAASNLALGSYLCFVAADWDRGIAFLSRGDDPLIKAAAMADLQVKTSAPKSQIAAGDAWWNAAEKATGRTQSSLYGRAHTQYEAALTSEQVAGLSRVRLEQRVAESASAGVATTSGEIRRVYEFKDPHALDAFRVIGPAKVTSSGELECLPTGAIVTREHFRYPIRAEFEFVGKADNCVDICPSFLGISGESLGVIYAFYHDQTISMILNKRERLQAEAPTAERVHKIVLSVDRKRNFRIEIDGKVIHEGIVDAAAELEGPVMLAAGNGHVVYRRCVVTALPSTTQLTAKAAGVGTSWMPLFRSADPSIWNTNTNRGKDNFAVSLSHCPTDVQFLKLSAGAGKTVIIPIIADQIGRANFNDNAKVGWNGNDQLGWAGRHLGIMRYTPPRTMLDVYGGGPIKNGFGFAHKSAANDKQYYTWDGEELPPTIFEISVKAAPLTPAEEKLLLK